jgi:hypothetical protein
VNPERWRLVTEIFHAALERPLERRSQYLMDACREDPSLRADLDALLAGDGRASVFGSPSAAARGALAPGHTVDAAPGRADSQRASFFRDVCGGDESFRQEVASRLAVRDGAVNSLESPALDAAANASTVERPLSVLHRSVADRVHPPRASWWIHLSAASFLGYFALVVFSVYYLPLDTGLSVRMEGTDRLFVASVTPASDADRADVLPGDRLLAINGGPVRTLRDYRAFAAAAHIGDSQSFVFERSGRPFVVAMSPLRSSRSSRLRFLPIQIGLFASLILSLIVIYSRPNDRVAMLGALLLGSVACAAAPNWPDGLAGTWRHLPVLVGALLWPACLSAATVGPIMFALFAIFPRIVIRRRWVWIAALTPAAIVAVWVGAYLMLVVYRPERSADLLRDWFTVAGPLSFPAYAAAGIAILIWNYQQSADLNERRRIRVLLCGMAVACSGGLLYVVAILLNDRGSHSVFSDPAPVVAGALFVALPFSFAYAVIAQRLFDIRILVRLGLQYALARRSILLLMPAILTGLLVDLLLHAEQPLIDILWQRGWTYLILVGLAAAAYRYRTGWLESIDRRFFRERYDAQQIFTRIIQDVRTVATLDSVAAMAVSRMSTAFHSSFVALLIRDPNQRAFHAVSVAPDTNRVPHLTAESAVVGLVRVVGKPVDFANARDWLVDQLSDQDAAAIRADGIELVAPIVTSSTERREAVLVFGAKRSEEPYSREDRELVAAVADSLALLIQSPSGEVGADTAFAECPRCGACDSISATRCAEDGSPLVRVALSRVLGGRYTIQRRVGRGGMGAVYEARDNALARLVAIKVIRDDMLASPDAADRFRREALIAASFTHSNVVTVHDFGIADNSRGYLVMELLIGTTLREALSEGRFSVPRMLQVMRDVCRAVDEAHRRQLIHRDLKPGNIFLVRNDVVKVLDFGIAKSVAAAPPPTFHTATGLVIGTLDYMSPEQRRGGMPHPSWDIWALAVIAYEMLVGECPFTETNSYDFRRTVAPGSWMHLANRRSDVPDSTDAIFARAFSVDPAERPAGALTFLDDMERALND